MKRYQITGRADWFTLNEMRRLLHEMQEGEKLEVTKLEDRKAKAKIQEEISEGRMPEEIIEEE